MSEMLIAQEFAHHKMLALPHTSLIICSRNRAQLLCELVRSILAGDHVPSEMVIVDDSDAHNETVARLRTDRECEIRYRWTRSRGLSRANNKGIEAARHDILVFTQDDVLVTPTWFGAIVSALLQAASRSVVTGRVPPEENNGMEHFAPSTISAGQPRVYQGNIGEGIFYLQNMAMTRDTFRAIGKFDEHIGPGTFYPAGEDNDYAYRLLDAGYRVVYCPEALVYHRAWRKRDHFLPLRWHYGLGRGAVYAKHWSKRFVRAQMFWDMRVHLVSALTRVRVARAQAYGDLALVGGIVVGAARWMLTERGR